jgi:predicted AlkP superfamily phosphohydrolase/phosphomutase
MGSPLLVVGLDGATFDLIEPLVAAGRLPVLAELMKRGAWGALRSTLPAATFPAWTSLVTGVNPGRHGLLDFTTREPGSYAIRFVNGSYRRTPALWTRLCAAGGRVAVVTVPATYPPEPVNGVMVSGFDSPLATEVDGRFVHPRAFHAEIRRLVGRLPFADFQETSIGPGWHEAALARLLEGVAKRTTVVEHLLRQEHFDAVMVVFGESDTVAHHFWRFWDPGSPRWVASPHADAIGRVYAALDAGLGRLLAAAPSDAVVAVVSDHGSGGASDVALHLNRRLAECGLLRFRSAGGGPAGHLRSAALRLVPHRLQGPALRNLPGFAGRLEGQYRFGGIDWSETVAFSEELDYHPSVWLNVRGREPDGVVDPGRYDDVRAQVVAALESWEHRDGQPVVDRVWRRDELYHGPAVDGAPDLLLELALRKGYSPSCLRSGGPGPSVRSLTADEFEGGKGAGMNGAHRRDGMFLLAGPGVRPGGRGATRDIVDMLPTLLALVGQPIPQGLDGRVMTDVISVRSTEVADAFPEGAAPAPYGPEAEAAVAARLAALGYLEPLP